MKELHKLHLPDKKYIIFDMDGTLIDSIGVWNITDQKLIQKYGGILVDLDEIQAKRDLFLHSVQTGNTYLEYSRYLIDTYHFSISDAFRLSNIRANLANEILAYEIDFKPDVVELIKRFKDLGFFLALATMTTKAQLQIYTTINQNMLRQMNIQESFDLIVTIEDVCHKKPHPEIYQKIMQHYYATPDECLIFEDSYTGVLAGIQSNIEVVHVYDSYAEIDQDKISAIADYQIQNYREFIELLDKQYPMKRLQK